MTPKEFRFHIAAGRRAGILRTCGSKVDHKNEERAVEAAIRMGAKYKIELTAYPCVFCDGWHIGRKFKDSP